MKVTVKQAVAAYNTLGEATVHTLEDAEISKVVKARKVLRPIHDEYDSYMKDCQEKFKPENWDKIQEDLQKWQQEGDAALSEERKFEINAALNSYNQKLEKAAAEELKKEVELDLIQFNEGTDVKLLKENKWKSKQLSDLSILFKED